MNKNEVFIQESYLDRALNHLVQGEFLQSEEWRKFQEAAGRKTFRLYNDTFYASIIEHQLSIVGKYFYVPRGPVCHPERAERVEGSNEFNKLDSSTMFGMTELINLAKKENAGWIRFDVNNSLILDLIRKNWRVAKSPHDMQPREILIIDITKPEGELLAEMKPKTRYNINLSRKRGVFVKAISNFQFPISKQISNSNDQNSKFYIDKFIKLVKITAKRDKITSHPESYYRKMFETIPPEILKLYVAEYENKVIAANIVVFYGNTATYLHGASDNEYRNVMAPYLLQWQAMLDTKRAGCQKYDLGGIKITNDQQPTTNDWFGITRFKTGFSPNTKPVVFPGSYDIILNPKKYYLYRVLQKIKKFL